MALPYNKYILYTPFVACATYYTSLFTVEFWETQPLTFTFVQAISNLLDTDVPITTRRGLLFVADAVDRLEERLRKDVKFHTRCGIGKEPPDVTRLGTAQAKALFPFYCTILLDRLYWSTLYKKGETVRITTYKGHPAHQDLAVAGVGGVSTKGIFSTGGHTRRFVVGTQERMDDVLNNFIRHVERLPMPQGAAWDETGPALASISQEDQDVDQPENLDQMTPEQKGAMIQQSNIMMNAYRLDSTADTFRVMSNTCSLAASALFLLMVSFKHLFLHNEANLFHRMTLLETSYICFTMPLGRHRADMISSRG